MEVIPEGTPAPDFTLQDQNGESHTLSTHKGKWVLLYFYPKDNTPGCTKQACVLRDADPDFKELNAVIYGISVDSVAAHKKFVEKYGLTFPLLADVDKKVVTTYGVWGQKKFMGHTYEGISRSSYLINPEGIIAKVYEKVKPANHASEVLVDLKELRNNG